MAENVGGPDHINKTETFHEVWHRCVRDLDDWTFSCHEIHRVCIKTVMPSSDIHFDHGSVILSLSCLYIMYHIILLFTASGNMYSIKSTR